MTNLSHARRPLGDDDARLAGSTQPRVPDMAWSLPYPSRRQPILADNVVAAEKALTTTQPTATTPEVK